jgi:hypothetical protein
MGFSRNVRRPNWREIALGVFGPIAIVASGLLIAQLTQGPSLPSRPGERIDPGGDLAVATPPDAPPPASDKNAAVFDPWGDAEDAPSTITRSVPSARAPSNGRTDTKGFKTVCCQRASGSAYWTAAEWCDDVGAAVDENLCAQVFVGSPHLPTRSNATPPLPPPSLAPNATDDCRDPEAGRRMSCALGREPVCCEALGEAFQTSRALCGTGPGRREVSPAHCESICCHHPQSKSSTWESRASCQASRAASVVDDDRCEEICCQLPDGALKRTVPRICAAREGKARAITACGTTVAVENANDREALEEGNTTFVDVDVNVNTRLPPATPFF